MSKENITYIGDDIIAPECMKLCGIKTVNKILIRSENGVGKTKNMIVLFRSASFYDAI